MLRPAPQVGEFDDGPYWEYCGKGELRVQRFKESGAYVWPPRPMDPHTRSLEYEWVPMSGRAPHFSPRPRIQAVCAASWSGVAGRQFRSSSVGG